jgi:hypothetical protein
MLEEQFYNVWSIFKDNPVFATAAVAILAGLFYFKPKSMFKLTTFCFFLVIAYYLITLLTGTVTSGSKKKDSMIYKSKEILDK